MKPIHISIIASLIGLLVIAAAPEEKREGGGKGEAKVDYVRSIVPGVTRGDVENASVEHRYTIQPR